MTNAASSRQIKARAKREAEDLKGERMVVVAFMSTPWGRRWMWLLLHKAQVFGTTFNQNPSQAAFNEGNRNFGLMLLSQITRHAPDMYIRMTNENSTANLKEDADGGSADDSNPDE